jgi:hypothetical protein
MAERMPQPPSEMGSRTRAAARRSTALADAVKMQAQAQAQAQTQAHLLPRRCASC